MNSLEQGGWSGIEVTQGNSLASSSAVNLSISGPIKGIAFTCDVCNKFFNSKAQYDVHVASKKHTDRMNRFAMSSKKKRFFPYWKKSKVLDPTEYNNISSGGYFNSA